jgi:hypothetical protein
MAAGSSAKRVSAMIERIADTEPLFSPPHGRQQGTHKRGGGGNARS